jgi:hypothetical protein
MVDLAILLSSIANRLIQLVNDISHDAFAIHFDVGVFPARRFLPTLTNTRRWFSAFISRRRSKAPPSLSLHLDASGGTFKPRFEKPLVKRHKLFIERSIFAVEICVRFLRFIRQFAFESVF